MRSAIPGLRLAYPVGPGERLVDADGRPLRLDPARHVTPLVRARRVVALVESDVRTVDALERELGPAAQLALGNERLRAEALARLEDVTGSRARIVETADAARRRMERDLHDGAQQRLLALTYDLRVALTIAESSGNEPAAAPLRAALDRRSPRRRSYGTSRTASSRPSWRRRARGGARVARRPTAAPPRGRAPGGSALPVRRRDGRLRSGRRGGRGGRARSPSQSSRTSGTLHLSVEGDVDWSERLVRLEDRVGAAGGSVRASGRTLEALLPVAPRPNA